MYAAKSWCTRYNVQAQHSQKYNTILSNGAQTKSTSSVCEQLLCKV